MGWKGAVRSMAAAARRAEREAIRRQRELERQQKEIEKMGEPQGLSFIEVNYISVSDSEEEK